MDRHALQAKLPSLKQSLSKRVVISYILDYLIILVLAAVFFALDAVEPFHQKFSLRNYTLRYPYAVHERIPVKYLLLIVVVAPAAIIAVYTLVIDGIFSHQDTNRKRKYTLKSRLWELNCGILGLLLANGLAFVITGALKNAIGKPRPDLIDRCQPEVQTASLFLVVGNYSLVGHSICTQTDNAILKDGFRSFPSGHSSSAFSGLFYLSLYLAGKLHFLDSKGEVWKAFVVMLPSLGAALTAGSRIMDARHHPFDVLSGSLLGILMAWLSYRQFFPSLSNFQAKGRAYPIRSWGPIDRDYAEIDINSAEPTAFIPGQETMPPSVSGNAFRDEIHASRNRRRQNGGSESTSPPRSSYPSTSRTPKSNSGGRYFRDEWEGLDDARASHDIELQPSNPRSGHYDPPPTHIPSHDTSYSNYRTSTNMETRPVQPTTSEAEVMGRPLHDT